MTKGAKVAAKPVSKQPARNKKAVKTVTPRKRGLDKRERVFVEEYLIDLKVERAALAAGYSATMAKTKAYQWVSDGKAKPHVYAAVTEALAKRSEKANITAELVLERLWLIATADPNELMSYRRLCCRYCFGDDHQYQWIDENEFIKAVRMAKAEELRPPTDEGGYGFDEKIRPHPLCPKCRGEGWGHSHFEDTRELSAQGRALYAGLKQTKQGMEIKTNDQMAALQMVGRHLGMFNDKLALGVDKDNPLMTFLQQLSGKTLKPVAEGVPVVKPQAEPVATVQPKRSWKR